MISMPAEAGFIELASDVAGKYTQLSGGTPAEAKALAASVASEAGRLANGSARDATVDLTFSIESGVIDVVLRCDGREATVRQPLPARKT